MEQTIGLRPMPVTWPVGVAGELRGLIECATGEFSRFTRTAGGATRATGRAGVGAEVDRAEEPGSTGRPRRTSSRCSHEIGAGFDEKDFLRRVGHAGAVRAGAERGRRRSGCSTRWSSWPRRRTPATTPTAGPRDLDAPTSGLVFKVQAGMDRSHRDRMAFVRICSGRFERGMVLTHAGTGRPFATKYAQAVFGQQRTTVEEAFPGDIVGLVNAGALRPGDTLYAEEPVEFPAIPSFAPEHFAVVRGADAGSFKQFRQGHRAARQRRRDPGTDLRPARRPGAGAGCGRARCSSRWSPSGSSREFRAPGDAGAARATRSPGAPTPRAPTCSPGRARSRCSRRRADGMLLAVFSNKWRLETMRRKFPDLTLQPLPAGAQR